MIETRTLWQRCEALGQFEDYKDDHVEMQFSDGRWLLKHDGHVLTFIYEDRIDGSKWLASAILCHIEAHHEAKMIADRSTVTPQNINEKLREALDAQDRRFPERLPDVTYVVEAPKPTEPTQEQLKALTAYIRQNMSVLNKCGFDVSDRQQATGGKGVRIHTVGNTKVHFCAVLDELLNGFIEFRCNIAFNDICQLIEYSPITEQHVIESPKESVPIPVTDWQQLREAVKTIQAIVYAEVKEVEFES